MKESKRPMEKYTGNKSMLDCRIPEIVLHDSGIKLREMILFGVLNALNEKDELGYVCASNDFLAQAINLTHLVTASVLLARLKKLGYISIINDVETGLHGTRRNIRKIIIEKKFEVNTHTNGRNFI